MQTKKTSETKSEVCPSPFLSLIQEELYEKSDMPALNNVKCVQVFLEGAEERERGRKNDK